jgi:hypothetical protein
MPAIPETGNPDHLTQNMKVGALRLSKEEMGLPASLRPGRFLRVTSPTR